MSNDGRLNVFDANGCGASVCQPLWRGIGGDDSFLVSSPAVADGVVYLGAYDGKLYAYDANGCGHRACQPLWTAQVGEHVNSSPAVANGVVYVGSGSDTPPSPPSTRQGAARRRAIRCGPPRSGRAATSVRHHRRQARSSSATANYVEVLRRRRVRGRRVPAAVAGPAQITGNTPAVSKGVVYIDAQPFRDHGTSHRRGRGVRRDGCGQDVCKPLWTGINFSNAPESSPVIANGVVYVGKGPASGFPVDSGVFSYAAAGCGKKVCPPLGFAQTGEQQFYLASSPAVANGHVYMGSTDTPTNQAGSVRVDAARQLRNGDQVSRTRGSIAA